MKMIKPSVTMYNIPDATDHDAVLMHLEKIGRTCYKSEDKITTNSAAKFLKNIRDRKHWAMLEHYIFTVSVPQWIYTCLLSLEAGLDDDPDFVMKQKFITHTNWKDCENERYKYLVSFSATSLNYLIGCDTLVESQCTPIAHLFQFMKNHYPELMLDPDSNIDRNCDPNISFITREEIKNLPDYIREVHDFMSVQFVVDRGVSHEIVRHRPASYAQESTRYCNYSKDKFGNEITVIIPCFFDTGFGENSNSLVFDEWKFACERAERSYFRLLEYGAKPEQARSVLPNSLKTEINMTASLYEFKHFFRMRCPHTAHPQMREVAVPLLSNVIDDKYYGNIFRDLSYLTTLQPGE